MFHFLRMEKLCKLFGVLEDDLSILSAFVYTTICISMNLQIFILPFGL